MCFTRFCRFCLVGWLFWYRKLVWTSVFIRKTFNKHFFYTPPKNRYYNMVNISLVPKETRHLNSISVFIFPFFFPRHFLSAFSRFYRFFFPRWKQIFINALLKIIKVEWEKKKLEMGGKVLIEEHIKKTDKK